MKKVIYIVIGFILGAICGIAVFDYIHASGQKVTIQSTTNIIIALASTLAVILSAISVKHQKDARVWETNKEMLLKLNLTLSDLMTQTSKLFEIEFEETQGSGVAPHNLVKSLDFTIYKTFDKYLTNTLDVYSPLLTQEIIVEIEKYQKADKNIEQAVCAGELNELQAYEELLSAQKSLQSTLNRNIKKYAKI